ncbi:MAG: bifunctional 2-polyprenyl-6-hydroxyphenol methylase/3-demethylubiquinol 3-O-methyltransferase UbiG [Gammaproteobacteria bacterium]|nr:bifunctional 2-polyprenyl-6-hydroxyphenol methylase/3-demethylubiquinol 3-O-methyltransferase UbiG [Gammaproteobacteria bacterium]MDH5730586.1 bifunctional 2-polyprenyl-6-hydroxyphenol methylase/3-demethylubiquinol 3-O-methyltransferase UbiG [Gammaproteobacteria bacterium]
METTSTNYEQAELNKFEQLAYRWWDPESEFKPLHEINPLRLRFIQKHCPLEGKQVLDVGCGGGILSEGMARMGAQVSGIDMGEAPLEVAKLHLLESGLNVDYQRCTAEDFAKQHPEKFDVVTCMEMLEHVPDPQSVIQACFELLKPGGQVFFSTINRNAKSYLFAIVGAEYLLKLLPKGTHDYKKFIKPAELANWMRVAQFDLSQIKGMSYNPITKQYSLGKDINVNYLVAGSKAEA